MLSAHAPLQHYPDSIKHEARLHGATAQVAGGVPTMCDGVTQGTPGMELSLFSRDVIAMATAVSLSHDMYDGALMLGVCDKIVPGLLIGALHFGHLPTVFVPAGPMTSGLSNNDGRMSGASGKVPVAIHVSPEAMAAVPLARALPADGIRMLEVTLRTPHALACIEAIARDVPEAIAGAGTVRSAADAQAAAMAGARFAVSPGYTHAVGRACRDLGLPLLPGVATGSEIMMAQEDGLNELKFFPAMQAGGVVMLKAWSGPFGDVSFCPTGGVTLQNAPELLALSNVLCVGGSWLVPGDAMASGDWARITQLACDSRDLKKPVFKASSGG